MNEEKPDPRDMYILARIINEQKPLSSQQELEVGKAMLKTAGLIDKCVFCMSIRHDTQPDFVDLIIKHFGDKHLVIDENEVIK